MSDKERLDLVLVEQGWFSSREKAKAAVMAGIVYLGQEKIEKAGTKIDRSAALKVKGNIHPYVSRGGLKLEKAIKYFQLDFVNQVVMDIGASTGGFTDCALQHGAAFVYSIDVGYNQLDWKIRNHQQVKVMERINFRYMTKEEMVGPEPSIAVIDVSFISLRLILPPLQSILSEAGMVVALIKPQFEAGKNQVGKSGIIKDPKVHRTVLLEILHFAHHLNFSFVGLTYSPITGGEGNIEFLTVLKKNITTINNNEQRLEINFSELIDEVIQEAHLHLKPV